MFHRVGAQQNAYIFRCFFESSSASTGAGRLDVQSPLLLSLSVAFSLARASLLECRIELERLGCCVVAMTRCHIRERTSTTASYVLITRKNVSQSVVVAIDTFSMMARSQHRFGIQSNLPFVLPRLQSSSMGMSTQCVFIMPTEKPEKPCRPA